MAFFYFKRDSSTFTNDVEFCRGSRLSGGVFTDRLNVPLVIECQRFDCQRRDDVTIRRLSFDFDSVRRLKLSLTFEPATQKLIHVQFFTTLPSQYQKCS